MALNAAFLHALGDSVQSVGVILAGIFIYLMNNWYRGSPVDAHSIYNLADPVCSLLFALVTLFTTKDLIKQLLGILMETTPESVDYVRLRRELAAIPYVDNLHDLHVWSLTANKAALSVHLVSSRQKEVLLAAQRICARHRIDHTTVQVDPPEVGAEKCVTRMGCHNC
jgi:zinc transporter 2